MNFLYVGIGGFLGASIRYFISLAFHKSLIATFVANIVGCFLIGILAVRIENQAIRLFLITGFLGGLTTFSTFSHEAFQLLENGFFLKALLYCFSSVFTGLLAVYLGLSLFR